jgi:hypothetical protein
MNRFSIKLGLTLLLLGTMIPVSAQGNQRYWNRYNQVNQIIRNIEQSTNEFRANLDRWLDQSRFNGREQEERFNSRVTALEQATDQLRREYDRTDSWWQTRNEVQRTLTAARPVEQMMRRQRFGREVETEWRRLRINLNRLAAMYRLPRV